MTKNAKKFFISVDLEGCSELFMRHAEQFKIFVGKSSGKVEESYIILRGLEDESGKLILQIERKGFSQNPNMVVTQRFEIRNERD